MDTVYADCETTSLTDPHLPEGRRTWEIALVRVPDDGSRPQAAWLQITDVDLAHANDVSLRISRFEQRFVPPCGRPDHCDRGYGPLDRVVTRPWDDPRPVELWGSTEANAAQTIDELTAGAVIAGSNPRFDMDSIADLLRRHGREPSFYHHPRDVPNIAQGWLSAMAPERWMNGTYPTRVLSEACGVAEPADRHSAWADVVWMMSLDAAIGGPSARLKPGIPAIVGA